MNIFSYGNSSPPSNSNKPNPSSLDKKELPDVTYKVKEIFGGVPSKTLEIYRLGKKIGEVKSHFTSLHRGLVEVSTVTGQKKWVREKDILGVYQKNVESLKTVNYEKNVQLYEIDKNQEKIIEVKNEMDDLENDFILIGEEYPKIKNKFMIENPVESKQAPLSETGEISYKNENQKDRKIRDEKMRAERDFSESVDVFKEKWSGSLDSKSLELAWKYNENLKAELNFNWNQIRSWLRAKEPDVLVKDWENKKINLLKDYSSEKLKNLIDYIESSLQNANPETKLVDLIDNTEILNRDKNSQQTADIAFDDQSPKYLKRYLEGIYNTAEQTQIFPIIQEVFVNKNILNISSEEFEKNIKQISAEIFNLMEASRTEANSLKKDISEFEDLENQLNSFMIKIIPDIIKKMTFSAAQNGMGGYQTTSNLNSILLLFDKECEEFLENLKKAYDLKLEPHENQLSQSEALLKKEKLFEYYLAKVDQMKIFMQENIKDIISSANQTPSKTKEEAINKFSSNYFINHNTFTVKRMEQIITDTKGGAFIGSCRAPLYQPSATEERLNHFIELVQEKRKDKELL